jgi:ATPase family associated with various cellular activities (AAA)
MLKAVNTDWHNLNQNYLMQAITRVRSYLQVHAGKEVLKKVEDEEDINFSSNFSSIESALERICKIFGLSLFERDILLLCAGVELDASFAPLCIAASGDNQRFYPTFSLALAVLPEPHWQALTPEAPLRRWQLIEIGSGYALTTSPLRIDEQILHYLTGIHQLDKRLAGMGVAVNSREQLVPSHWQIAEQMANTWCVASKEEKILPVLQLCGKDVASQRAIAAAACRQVNLIPYSISTQLLATDTVSLKLSQSLWEREYLLNSAALLLELDSFDTGDAKQESLISQFIESLQAPLIIISNQRRRQKYRSLISFDVESPTSDEQLLLWQSALGDMAAEINGHTSVLVSHFNLSAESIFAASLKARSMGKQDERDVINQYNSNQDAINRVSTLWDICRANARPRLDELAQRVESSSDWEDLVLPEIQKQVLRDLAAQLQYRSQVYNEWGFGSKSKRGLGISALFAGGSGTGKTLAADVLACALKLDLYRIDLSAVVSKYIGETEKNLGRVFDAAEMGGVILLFDEADALFGKRSDVKDSHDRYANMEVAYLLQRMETYPGLAILTTNLKNSIDQAFLRRIRFIVQFPFPDANQRAEIWRRVFPAQTPKEGLDEVKLAKLSVAGGNIRNIALNAAFIAAQAGESVRMEHILQAAKNEYAKMERPLTDTEVKGWV